MENLSSGSHTGFWGDPAGTPVTSLVARLDSADWLTGGEAWGRGSRAVPLLH